MRPFTSTTGVIWPANPHFCASSRIFCLLQHFLPPPSLNSLFAGHERQHKVNMSLSWTQCWSSVCGNQAAPSTRRGRPFTLLLPLSVVLIRTCHCPSPWGLPLPSPHPQSPIPLPSSIKASLGCSSSICRCLDSLGKIMQSRENSLIPTGKHLLGWLSRIEESVSSPLGFLPSLCGCVFPGQHKWRLIWHALYV